MHVENEILFTASVFLFQNSVVDRPINYLQIIKGHISKNTKTTFVRKCCIKPIRNINTNVVTKKWATLAIQINIIKNNSLGRLLNANLNGQIVISIFRVDNRLNPTMHRDSTLFARLHWGVIAITRRRCPRPHVKCCRTRLGISIS